MSSALPVIELNSRTLSLDSAFPLANLESALMSYLKTPEQQEQAFDTSSIPKISREQAAAAVPRKLGLHLALFKIRLPPELFPIFQVKLLWTSWRLHLCRRSTMPSRHPLMLYNPCTPLSLRLYPNCKPMAQFCEAVPSRLR